MRIPVRAGLALLALLAAVPPAHAEEEPTVVGYSSDAAAFISLVYTPVPRPEIVVAPSFAAKADCLADYTGTGTEDSTTIVATFVAKVVTDAQKEGGRPQDSIAVATGIRCSLLDERDNSPIFEWTAVRPGNAAADVWVQNVESVRHPKICVEAWVTYGDGTTKTINKRCDRP